MQHFLVLVHVRVVLMVSLLEAVLLGLLPVTFFWTSGYFQMAKKSYFGKIKNESSRHKSGFEQKKANVGVLHLVKKFIQLLF